MTEKTGKFEKRLEEKKSTFRAFPSWAKKSSKRANSTNLLLYMTPQSAGINVQSPQSESTPRRLTLILTLDIGK